MTPRAGLACFLSFPTIACVPASVRPYEHTSQSTRTKPPGYLLVHVTAATAVTNVKYSHYVYINTNHIPPAGDIEFTEFGFLRGGYFKGCMENHFKRDLKIQVDEGPVHRLAKLTCPATSQTSLRSRSCPCSEPTPRTPLGGSLARHLRPLGPDRTSNSSSSAHEVA